MLITEDYTEQDMTKQGNGAKSEVSKMRDTAVVDFPSNKNHSHSSKGFKARCLKKKPGNGKLLKGNTHQ